MSENKQDTRSAATRLTELENVAAQLNNTNNHILNDLNTIKNVVTLLNEKLNAITQASLADEPLSDEVLDRIMVSNRTSELANKVANLVVSGILTPEDQVTESSFVVGSEQEEDGRVTNPRVQFTLNNLSPELKPKLLGAKPGDLVKFKEGTISFKLLETYTIVPKAAETSSALAVEAAPAEQAPSEPVPETVQPEATPAS